MLAEEVVVLDADARLWPPLKPLLNAAFRLAHGDDDFSWHGWSKREISSFLQRLPAHCSLLACVWDTLQTDDGDEREVLVTGCVCEVVAGEVRTIRTLEALYATLHADAGGKTDTTGLPPLEQLEPGFEHALALMRVAREQVAPVAWALFTDKASWDAWLFGAAATDGVDNKGEQLTKLALQGRCVLMGSQAATHHH